MTDNGYTSTINELLDQARKQLDSETTDDFDRTVVLLLVAITSRQNDILRRVQVSQGEILGKLDTISKSPLVALSEFARHNKGVVILTLTVVIMFLAVVASLDGSSVLDTLRIP